MKIILDEINWAIDEHNFASFTLASVYFYCYRCNKYSEYVSDEGLCDLCEDKIISRVTGVVY